MIRIIKTLSSSEQIGAGGNTQAAAAPQGRNKYFYNLYFNIILCLQGVTGVIVVNGETHCTVSW